MTVETVHLNDIGTQFIVTIYEDGVPLNISTASLMRILFEKSNGTKLSKTAVFVSNGTDGKIKYTTLTGDLDTAGTWRIQGYIEMGGGKWHSEIAYFTVQPNLD